MIADITDITTLSTKIAVTTRHCVIHTVLRNNGGVFNNTKDNKVFVTEIWSGEYEDCYFSKASC